jgi:hypothetical protein
MDSSVLGLGAVAWTEAWNATATDTGLRLAVDPARLLVLLKDVPASRALLSDLQRAVPSGRTVELLVSADRQVAEISTGTSRYVLTMAARNVVLNALLATSPDNAPRAGSRPLPPGHEPSATLVASRSVAPAAGILWQSPSAAAHVDGPMLTLALPWLGLQAQLEVGRDGKRQAGTAEAAEAQVHFATLRLQLERIGAIAARIRVCGSTVAILIECPDPERLDPHLDALTRALSDHGLQTAHVGAVGAAARE